jgi:hypothetical protein
MVKSYGNERIHILSSIFHQRESSDNLCPSFVVVMIELFGENIKQFQFNWRAM